MSRCTLKENNIDEVVVKLQNQLYEVKQEYIQLLHSLSDEQCIKYKLKIHCIQGKICFLNETTKKNIYYLSDLNEQHIRYIQSSL